MALGPVRTLPSSAVCHGYAIGVLIFPQFFLIFLDFLHQPSSNPAQAPAHVICTWHPCASSHATLQDPAITHVADAPSARPPSRAYILGRASGLQAPGPYLLFQLSPLVSVSLRYRTILVNSPIGPRTHLASPLLSPHCFTF